MRSFPNDIAVGMIAIHEFIKVGTDHRTGAFFCLVKLCQYNFLFFVEFSAVKNRSRQ